MAAGSNVVRAEGLFDFLFSGFRQHSTSSSASAYADPGRVAPPALGSESVQGDSGTGTGRVAAFCVRLCDGQHFPLEHSSNATPIETCRAMCPASRTKVFFGNGIERAVTRDGARYADLDNALLYRKHLVPGCTCDGKHSYGLAPFDAATDPTLRPGDIVATKDGFVTYTGQRGQTAQFAPTDPSALTAELNQAGSRTRVAKKAEPPPADAEEETGTIVPSQNSQSRALPAVVDARGQAFR